MTVLSVIVELNVWGAGPCIPRCLDKFLNEKSENITRTCENRPVGNSLSAVLLFCTFPRVPLGVQLPNEDTSLLRFPGSILLLRGAGN